MIHVPEDEGKALVEDRWKLAVAAEFESSNFGDVVLASEKDVLVAIAETVKVDV